MSTLVKKPASQGALEAAEMEAALNCESDHFHPLESIALFRRWPRSFMRNLVYTLIFNAMFALAFTAMALVRGNVITLGELAERFGNNLIISNAIGFAFWLVMSGMGPVLRKINRRSFVEVALFYSILGTGIVTLSFVGLSYLPGYSGMQVWVLTPPQLVSSFVISFFISLVLAATWRRRVAELASQIALSQERERSAAAERAATQANLRALQAQIEPHFLFNTLANVASLIQSRPDVAKKMLEEFIAYLRATLATTREAETTLAREFELMHNFLSVLKVRMGQRLTVQTGMSDEVKGFAIPSMLIQPLVENAIRHGLEPKIDGGNIALSARRNGDMVEIIVADTGLGFQNSNSDGIGLMNVRERLEKLYDGKAVLSIEDNDPCGTKITISIPVFKA